MRKPIARGLLCGFLVLVLSLASPVLAQDGGDDAQASEESAAAEKAAAEKNAAAEAAAKKKQADAKKKKRGRKWGRSADDEEWGAEKARQLGKSVSKKYYGAYELYQQEQYDAAIRMLKSVRLTRRTEYEKAKVFEMLGFCAYAKEDVKGSREYMQLALAENAFKADKQENIQFNVARMYGSEQDWDNVIVSLDKWFAMVDEPQGASAAYNLLALAHYQKQDYEAALGPAQKAVDLMAKPNEGWIRLLLALRLTRQDYAESVPLLEQLVTNFPKKLYWMQLSTVHGALGSYENALVPLQLAYTQDLLTLDPELRRLAQLMMFLELPYRSALALEGGFDSGVIKTDIDGLELLSNSWIAAREYEKSVVPLEKAADLDETGDLYVRLAQVHIQREKWSDATQALSRAVSKGGLEAPGEAMLLMGIAHYSNKSLPKARRWFVRARAHGDARKEANTWIQYVDRELAVLEAANGSKPSAPAAAAEPAAGAPADAAL